MSINVSYGREMHHVHDVGRTVLSSRTKPSWGSDGDGLRRERATVSSRNATPVLTRALARGAEAVHRLGRLGFLSAGAATTTRRCYRASVKMVVQISAGERQGEPVADTRPFVVTEVDELPVGRFLRDAPNILNNRGPFALCRYPPHIIRRHQRRQPLRGGSDASGATAPG
jgi:hypothetical protein